MRRRGVKKKLPLQADDSTGCVATRLIGGVWDLCLWCAAVSVREFFFFLSHVQRCSFGVGPSLKSASRVREIDRIDTLNTLWGFGASLSFFLGVIASGETLVDVPRNK